MVGAAFHTDHVFGINELRKNQQSGTSPNCLLHWLVQNTQAHTHTQALTFLGGATGATDTPLVIGVLDSERPGSPLMVGSTPPVPNLGGGGRGGG